MIRSVLAIGSGFVFFMVWGFLTGAAWGSGRSSPLSLFGGALGMLLTGYIAACLSRRAYLTHTFVVALLCIAVTAFVGHSNGVQRDWGRWGVGAFTAILWTTWSGLFRNWQLSHGSPNKPMQPTPR